MSRATEDHVDVLFALIGASMIGAAIKRLKSQSYR
ncbi:hypothetical protein CA13_45580 [Planctomycetes bacterium CA13]|uniref:Uncharacterized protein n=1 Tax=Novipirellula herctigrandis TaxID=2527986 RepID=A0A5C5Z788_9BACT|nr:hypothetical protein CA13_45580 [Planctomycetes bacterium CA13]